MSRKGFFFAAPWARGLLESLAPAFALLLLIRLTDVDAPSGFFPMLATTGITASYAAFRIRRYAGARRDILFGELWIAALFGAGFGFMDGLSWLAVQAHASAGFSLAEVLAAPPYSDILIELLYAGFGAGVYLGWRMVGWMWEKWDRMRRTRFIWGVMQVFALTVLGIVLIAIMLVLAVVLLPGSPYKANSGAANQVVAAIFQYLFGLMMVTPVVLAPVLIMLLPPMALASYWMTRRFSKRLQQLEDAAHRLSQGDLSARAPMDGEDEIAHLQEDFNQMADQLEKSNQALVGERDRVTGLLEAQRHLTASISHDLRTPVSIALAALENTLDNPGTQTAGQQQKDLETAHHEIIHLQHLIDDLFAVSKAETNHLSLRLAATDLRPIVQNAVSGMQSIAWDGGRVRVTMELPETLPAVQADATRVEQVLINLLNNGIRHTPPGGFVLVTGEVRDECVQVAVIDSGSGISAEALPHVWEPYFTVAENPGADHSGLGLAIVKELVHSMRGEVDAESQPGQGSTFSFSLKQCPP